MFFKIAGWLAVTLSAVVLAAIAGARWWDLWISDGWPGATGWLADAMGVQGEAYYDAMQGEMTLLIFLLLMGLSLLVRRTVLRLRNGSD